MKRLNELIKCKYKTPIYGIKTNSKNVKQGDLFVAIHGFNCDHHTYISEAIKNNASAIISEKKFDTDVPVVIVKNTNIALRKICKKFYSNIEQEFTFIGITGTDGKTTTSTIIYEILKDIKHCCNMGTNGIFYKEITLNTENTTPEIVNLYNDLLVLNKNGCKTVSMEVSSEALLHRRVDNIKYDIAILTNITEDHLNIHKTLNNYINTKKKLFSKVKKQGYCILNRDDKYYERIKNGCKANLITYGKNKNSDFRICNIICKDDCTMFKILYQNKEFTVRTFLKGEYNVYNVTAAFICSYLIGIDYQTIINKIKLIKYIPGRGERLNFGQNYTIILDYAHTENGVENILNTLRKEKKSKIITVTGSAGGREKEKRKKIGKIVLELSDYVIFTMDDPRNEKILDIIKDMLDDTTNKNYEIIENREKAIFKALSFAKKEDIVAILGKGRDNYMAVGNKKIPYSDYEVIKRYFYTP